MSFEYTRAMQLSAASLHPGVVVAIVAVALGLVFVGRLCVVRLCVTPANIDEQQSAVTRDAEEDSLIRSHAAGGPKQEHSGVHPSDGDRYRTTDTEPGNTFVTVIDPNNPNQQKTPEPVAMVSKPSQLALSAVKRSSFDREAKEGTQNASTALCAAGPAADGHYPPECALQQVEQAVARGAPVVRGRDQLEIDDAGSDDEYQYGEGED